MLLADTAYQFGETSNTKIIPPKESSEIVGAKDSKELLLLIELLVLVITGVLALLWLVYPASNWEPWTLVCGIIVALMEIVRRYRKPNGESYLPERDSSSPAFSQQLLIQIREKPLSVVLPIALDFAQHIGNREFERWIRLELYGYNEQGGMRDADVVPEYRGVTGRWLDQYGNILDLSDYPDLGMVNTYRLRFGARKLEELAARNQMQSLVDDSCAGLFRKYMQLEIVRFSFSPVEVIGILDTIRNLLAAKVRAHLVG